MSDLFGFDEVLEGIVQAHPEVRLHIARCDNKTIASASSSDQLAIAAGTVGASPGPIVRQALVDLRRRLLERDREAIASAEAAASDKLQEYISSFNDAKASQRELDDDICCLTDELCDCSMEDFDSISQKLRLARLLKDELSLKLSGLRDLISDLDPDCPCLADCSF